MMNGRIDLRSDTVTHPTPAMRKAMGEALVGDDVYGDDPTVNALEKLAASLSGKEAALFVPSGTMGNQLALSVHVRRGDEVILPDNCHIVVHEAGAAAYLSGAQLRCLPAGRGIPMDPAAVERTIRKSPEDIHSPRTALISYENADSDGFVRPLRYMDEIRQLAERYQVPVHLDGARIFNAAAALGVTAADVAACADSVMFCLSKGLCAPVGSMLCGTSAFIAEARRRRKVLGGGMRQAGILAAAGLIALTDMTGRLAEDHEKARRLARLLAAVPGIGVEPGEPEINMVFFRLDGYPLNPEDLAARLAAEGILINGPDEGLFRFVTHYWVDSDDLNRVVSRMSKWSVR